MVTNRRHARAFTLIELLVVIAIVAVLVAILFPTLNRAREAGKRAACMSNLRQLQIAWQTYADEHHGCIVNGQALYMGGSEVLKNYGQEWLIGGWTKGYSWPILSTVADGEALMHTGALAPYVGNARAYLCPSRYRRTEWLPGSEWLSSYTIVSSMNVFAPGQWSAWDSRVRATHAIGRTVLYIRKTSELLDPGPSSRTVFLDTAAPTGYSGSQCAGWGYDAGEKYPPFALEIPLSTHHSNGTCLSFADGHSERWKWRDANTIEWGEWWEEVYRVGYARASPQPPWPRWSNPDYLRVHEAIWGKGP